jgi:GAF domain-containing protein
MVRTSAPVLVRNAAKDPRTMRQWGVRDMLGVPLVVAGEVTGTVCVDDQGSFHESTGRDVRLAQAFASLTALVVRQGWLYCQA